MKLTPEEMSMLETLRELKKSNTDTTELINTVSTVDANLAKLLQQYFNED
jgi:hypothetical protein